MSSDDASRVGTDIVYQPDVYEAAAHLARCAGADTIVVVGCGSADELLPLANEFDLIGVGTGLDRERACMHAREHVWLMGDAERGRPARLAREVVQRSVVLCANVIGRSIDPAELLATLRQLADDAVAVLVSTPGRIPVPEPRDSAHSPESPLVREWSLADFVERLKAAGLPPTFAGLTADNSRDRLKRACLAIVEPPEARRLEPAPREFRPTAVLTAFNEADIIVPSIRVLLDQGVNVHVVDNWSTDATAQLALALGTGDRLTVERFPVDEPTGTFDWERLLRHVEAIAERRDGWLVFQDVDEIRRTPWQGVDLLDGLWHAHRRGYNAVGFTTLVFHPIDNDFVPGADLETSFRYFEFGSRPGHFLQIRAWNARAGRAQLAPSGGHEAAFPHRRVFPYKFLSKHFPIRSQAHGERKVFAERVSRWNAEERARGWHTHYDGFGTAASFVRRPEDLLPWDEQDFSRTYLTERLTGVGIERLS